MWEQLSPVGHFLIMLIPLVIMPISSAMLTRYSRTYGVERYPFPASRIVSSLAVYASMGLTILFFYVPGIHATWAFATLALFATSLEASLHLTRSPFSLRPYKGPLVYAAAVTSLFVGFYEPRWVPLAVWAAVGVALQAASVVALTRGSVAQSPARLTIAGGYALGMVAVPLGAWIVVFDVAGTVVDFELVLVTVSALLMSIGATTYALETTAEALMRTRDRITAEVELRTAELQEANRQLRQVDRMKDQFLSTVSHELRTPLTTIRGYTEFLEDEIEGPLSDGNQAFVREIQEAAAVMGHKVDDLLDLARISSGALRYEFAPFCYRGVLDRLEGLMRPVLAARGQTLTVSAPPALGMVGDRNRIQQVLINLVTNASKFSPEGAAIVVRAIEADGSVVTTVEDAGMGIPEEHLQRIFQAFYQVDGTTTRSHAGIGLGLAIVRSLVEAHRGHVEVQSRVGEGSRFTVVLPKAPEGVPTAITTV